MPDDGYTPRPEMFVPGYLNDRYLRGERPDMSAPRMSALPDTGGRVMDVRTSWSVGAEIQRLRKEEALTNSRVQAKHGG